VRDRYNRFIDRHDVAWELGMAALAIAYVVLGFAAEDGPAWMATAETLITGIFIAEFVTRILAAYDRRAYLRSHWIDLLALTPAVREIRLLRLLRLLRLVRAVAGIYRALLHVERLIAHRAIASLIAIWFSVMLVSSLAMYAAEHGVNEAVTSPLDALWWGVVTMTTVGYGDISPQTGEGRIAAVVLMVLGITLFGLITATAASILTTGGEDATEAASLTEARQLARLYQEGVLSGEQFAEQAGRLLAPEDSKGAPRASLTVATTTRKLTASLTGKPTD
jgi:voltage-gated potassium channel